MLPHVHVHRRSHQNRRRRGQVHGGQKIVGDAVRKLGQNVGGRRSNDQRIGPLRLADVLDAVLFDGCVVVGVGSSQRLVITLWPVSAANVSGWITAGRLGHHHMDFNAWRCRARTSSAAL